VTPPDYEYLRTYLKAIEPDGFLALGAAETVLGLTNLFKPVAERRGVYQLNEVHCLAMRTPAFGASAPKVAVMAGI
jgi:chemotaxis protein methyltransferase CheR